MQAFSNENIKDKLCGGCDCTGFTPAITWGLSGNTLTLTDASTYPAGGGRKTIKISVHDKRGGKVVGTITEGDGDGAQAVNIATLDRSEGIRIWATIVTLEGCVSDGHAEMLGTSGALGSFDKDNNALTIGGDGASS